MTRGTLSALILFLIDIMVSFGSVVAAKRLQYYLPELCLPDELLLNKAAVFSLVTVACYYFQDLYAWRYMRKLSEVLSSILLGGGITLIALAAIYFMIPLLSLERDVLILALILSLAASFTLRSAFLRVRYSDYGSTRVVIYGDGENAQFLLNEIRSGSYPIIFEGYIGKKNWDMTARHLGDPSDLSRIIAKAAPDVMVVALDGWRGNFPVDELLRIKLSLCDVTDAPSFYEDTTGRILVEEIRPSSMIFSRGFLRSHLYDATKRSFDIFCGVIGLITFSPIMLITALVIKLDSRGPVFYLQPRVGKDGKDFSVIKFRSMFQDAESAGPQWASENDPRVTRVGRFIRKARIDELPQFINVLKNDMSFVGPRPERRFFVNQLEQHIPFYALRLHLKPGITGWAQINYPYGDTFEDAKEKLKYELYYAKHRSFWLDIVIILQTIKVAIKGRGAQ